MKSRLNSILIITFFSLLTSSCFSEDDLYTKANEKTVFGFDTSKGKKLTLSMDKNGKYIVYRYGTPDKVELEFPDNKSQSYELFTYSHYMRGGGAANSGMDLNWLRFQNGEYQFVIYDEMVAEGDIKKLGIKLIHQKTRKIIDIKGDVTSKQGSLVDFRFMDKVKKDSYQPD